MNASDSQRFHQDLAAALMVRVPLEIGNSRSRGHRHRLTLSRLNELETQIDPWLTQGDSTSADRAEFLHALRSHAELPIRYRAALETFQQTNTMLPVLEGLTIRTVAQSQATRVLRWAFIYLMLVLLIALAGMLLFDSFVAPSIESMRADSPPRFLSRASSRWDTLPWLPTMAMALGVMFGGMLLWLLAGGARAAAMWLGGRQFVRCRTTATALRTLQALLTKGMPVSEAVSASCDLAGADDSVWHVVSRAADEGQASGQLESLADYYSITAAQRLDFMRFTTPVAMVAICGGVIGLLYCLALFGPIVGLLHDLEAAAK